MNKNCIVSVPSPTGGMLHRSEAEVFAAFGSEPFRKGLVEHSHLCPCLDPIDGPPYF